MKTIFLNEAQLIYLQWFEIMKLEVLVTTKIKYFSLEIVRGIIFVFYFKISKILF
jgi:hypothetical protein